MGFAAAMPLAGAFASATSVAAVCLSVTAAFLAVRFVYLKFTARTNVPAVQPAADCVAPAPPWLQVASLLLAGSAIPLISRVLVQTMTGSLYCISCGIAAIALGFTVGRTDAGVSQSRWRRGANRALKTVTSPIVASALFCVSLVSTVLLFPQITQLQLHVNATFETSWMVLGARGVVAAMFLLPVGLMCGSVTKQSGRSNAYAAPAVTVAVGSAASWWLISSNASLPWLAAGLALGGFVLGCCLLKPIAGTWLPVGRFSRAGFVALLATVAATPFLTARFQPDVAARLLFSSAIFREYARGTDLAMLLASTDSRLLSANETPSGTKSAWRVGGAQLQIRRNGAPVAISSSNPSTYPQSTTASLPVLLPMLLKTAPQDVLLLGDSGPAAESTVLRFPVQSVTTLHQQMRSIPELDSTFATRHDDPRFTYLNAPPRVGLTGLSLQYDVVISNPPPTADLDGAAFFTTSFYDSIAQRVSSDGLFCQMFRQIDFGPEPMHRVLASLAQSFTSVAAVRLEAGEILLLATNGDSIIDRGLARRTQDRATRQILDELGWDWSKLLELASLDAESVVAITSDVTTQNTTTNSCLLWTLPFETMRWGDKQNEIRLSLAGYQRRIIDQLEEDDYRAEAARRIAELQEEREVLFGFPDEPWVYRRTLRSRLEKHPRPPEPVVKNGTVKRRAHATDRYRVEYFKALANAIQQSRSNPESIRGLESFVAPTEPLLSYFASHEAARLLADVGSEPDAELFHRLRTIYFIPASSRSVREIVAAIDLIVKQPELIPDPADRWDRVNSLLQTMMNRWAARVDIAPSSTQVAINDIDLCLNAFESAMVAMEEWADDSNIDVVTVANRRRYLRRRLEHPLRGYRDQLLPHYDGTGSIAGDDDVRFRPLGN